MMDTILPYSISQTVKPQVEEYFVVLEPKRKTFSAGAIYLFHYISSIGMANSST